jgi:hypothetical protein
MGLFGLGKKQHATHILIDIGSASVGGAYAHIESNGRPTIHYATRIIIETRDGETVDASMVRTLKEVTDALVKDGAPQVRRETGNAHADGVLVSVAAPWQETKIRTETTQAVRPFLFTKKLLSELVAKNAKIPEDRIDSGDSVIATILNGYETANPFGKHVKRVELVVLSSTLQKDVTDEVEKTLRGAFHTHQISFTGFAPASYQVFRDLYPHEHDYLLLDIRGVRSDLAFIQRGLLMDVGSIQLGTHDLLSLGRAAIDDGVQITPRTGDLGASYLNPERNARFGVRVAEAQEHWVSGLAELLRTFSNKHALPRTLFLLADDDVRGYLIRALDAPILHSLWLSDEPLRIVPVTPAQFSSYVRLQGDVAGDIFLELLALYYAKSIRPLVPDPEPVPAKEQSPRDKKDGKDQKADATKEPAIPLSAMVSSSSIDGLDADAPADFSM